MAKGIIIGVLLVIVPILLLIVWVMIQPILWWNSRMKNDMRIIASDCEIEKLYNSGKGVKYNDLPCDISSEETLKRWAKEDEDEEKSKKTSTD